MTIVCGTDFSNASREAASVAASLARRRAEPLLLVHSAPYAGFDHEKLQASIEAEASALRTAGLLVSTELRFGWPDEDIDEVAEAANASLIVLGAVGHRAG
ncbi:MAG: universal stress protein, partial [Acidobacteriota bacterium]